MTARRPLAIAAVMTSTFMAAMEATVVGTAMPTVVADLGGLELYGWVGAIYMLATTVTIPIYGKLADLWGRKPVMLAGIAVFLLGSAASGAAHSMTMLIAARAVQGVGAGAIQPIALTIVGDLFSPAERARIQGLFGAVWGLAGIAGPLVGGLFVRVLSWRWVFYINVPFGLLSAVTLVLALPGRGERPPVRRPIDFVGAALLTVAVLALLAGIGGEWPAVLLPVTALALVLFVLVERRHPEPLLPIELLTRRLIAVSSAAGAVVGGVMTASVIYVPLFVQAVERGTPTQAGSAVAPMLVGWPIASAASGKMLLRFGAQPLVRIGFVLVGGSTVALDVLLAHGGGIGSIRVCMFLLGTGLGLANTALLIAVQESVGYAQRGVATASTMFFRTIGGALAVGALGAVLARTLGGRVPEDVLDAILGPEHGKGLAADVLARYSPILSGGMAPLFHAIAGMGAAGAVVGMLFPRVDFAPRAPGKAPPVVATE